jgi:hypothetical protein
MGVAMTTASGIPPIGCIYCAGRRNDPKMSLEHIWPDALGGTAAPALFKTRNACRSCNNLAGQWVDGAFLKSWFVSHEAGAAARLYLDPQKPGIVPMVYMGMDQEFPVQPGEICERWVGAAGGHVYHVHTEDDDKWHGYAGGDFIARKKFDAGRAYLVLTSQSLYWALTALQSFAAQFSRARLFCVTKLDGMPPTLAHSYVEEKDASKIEVDEISWIRARPDGQQQPHKFSLRLDFSDRFLAKLSLGLGANILGERYLDSPYAGELRKLLWLQGGIGTVEPAVKGRNYWQEPQTPHLSKILSWPGAWTILLLAPREGFVLHVNTPSGRGMTMALSDDCTFWSGADFQTYRDGAVFIAVPARQVFVGPISLPLYLAHQLGSFSESNLASLAAMRADPALLPKMS